MTRTSLIAAVLIMALALGLVGCESERDSGELAVEFSENGKSWRCVVDGRTLVFLDADNDGLSEACDVYQGDIFLKHVEWDRRMYFREDDTSEIPRLLASIQPDNVVAVNLLIPPKPPFTETPARSDRVTDHDFLVIVACQLRDDSYSWGSFWERYPDNMSVGDWSTPRFRCSAWFGMEVWLRNHSAPLTIMVHHLENSYELHEEGLKVTWKGQTMGLANDALSEMFADFLTVPRYGEKTVESIFLGRDLSRSAHFKATYFGDIPVRRDGKPCEIVTLPEKIKQVKALLRAYRSQLIEDT